MADLSITPGNVVASNPLRGKKATCAAGVTVTAGQLVALDSAGDIVLCDANSTTALQRVPIGIALCGGSPGQPILYCDNDDTLVIGATVVVGMGYFASITAGGISPMGDPTTGNYLAFVGYGVSTTELKLAISSGETALLADPTP